MNLILLHGFQILRLVISRSKDSYNIFQSQITITYSSFSGLSSLFWIVINSRIYPTFLKQENIEYYYQFLRFLPLRPFSYFALRILSFLASFFSSTFFAASILSSFATDASPSACFTNELRRCSCIVANGFD